MNLSKLAVFEFGEGRDNQRETEYSLHVRWRIAWIPGAGQIISIDGEDFKALCVLIYLCGQCLKLLYFWSVFPSLFVLRWKLMSCRYRYLLLIYKQFFIFGPFVSTDELFLNINCRALIGKSCLSG